MKPTHPTWIRVALCAALLCPLAAQAQKPARDPVRALAERASGGDRAALEALIERARKTQDAEAEFALGMMIHEGRGLARNAAQAFKLIERAAGRGHPEACNMLGYFFEHGAGTPADTERALAWYRRGAEAGSARAQTNLGWFYEQGTAVAKDPAQAVEWYRKAAAQGLPAAQFNLANLVAAGSGTAKDEAAAIDLYQRALAGGLAPAGLSLGRLLESRGEFTQASAQYVAAARAQVAEADMSAARLLLLPANPRRDPAEAVLWLEKAASRGQLDALRMLANLYDKGGEVGKDAVKAAEYFRRAAVRGDREAAFRAGDYADAQGRNPEPWYWQAAVQGHPEAQYRLARLRQKYAGSDKAVQGEAASWYRKSADQGNPAAALQLGILLETGTGVAAAPAEALSWYEKAAAANDPEALFRLGNLYDRGLGTPPDFARARDYYARAAALGHKGAEEVLQKAAGLPPLDKVLGDPFKGIR